MKTDSKMITKLFFSLLPVQILLVAINSINSIIDGTMASNIIGPDSMAMTGLYAPLIKIIETVNAVLLGGSQILCGQYLGKNQVKRTRSIFSLDLFLVIVLSMIITILSIITPVSLAKILGAQGSNIDGLSGYVRGMAFGILPQMLSIQLTAFLQLEQQNKRTYFGIGGMVFTNCILDVVFLKVMNLGMFGLGLATSISYIVFFVILGQYYFTKNAIIKFEFKGIVWKDIGPILKIGIPGAVVVFCLALRGVIINALLIKYSGNDGLGALSALNNFGNLFYAATAGVASATRLLVSVYIGEEDRTSIIMIMKTALTKGLMLISAVAIMVIILAVPFTYIFFKDPTSNIFYLTKWIFRIFPFSMPLSLICVVFINYYQCSSRMKIVNVLSVMDGVVGIAISSLILAPIFGAMGIWVAHVLSGVYTTIVVFGYACIKNKKFPTSIEQLICIPKNFGVDEDKRLDITIHNEEEVTDTSQLVMDFCRKQNIDKKRSYYAGLCMEEMASNIVKHGFSDGKKHTADVRIVNKGDERLLLRIKDNCKSFNPKEKAELVDPTDITHNIGTRMVHSLAKEMFYNNALGLNVLTITI